MVTERDWRKGQSTNKTMNNNMKTKHLIQAALLASLAAFTPDASSQNAAPERQQTEAKESAKPGTLTAMIADSTSFSTLTKALKAAELDVTLGGKGEFTVFAPTDDAFGKLPAEVLTKLLLPENKEKLRSLLLYHVVAGKLLAADLKDGKVKTMNGEKVEIDAGADRIEIDGAKVFSADVMASNGVMHSLGKVIIPESLDGFAGLKL